MTGPDDLAGLLLGRRDDGSQVLVMVYRDGSAELTERPGAHTTWGPPVRLLAQEVGSVP